MREKNFSEVCCLYRHGRRPKQRQVDIVGRLNPCVYMIWSERAQSAFVLRSAWMVLSECAFTKDRGRLL